MHAAAATTAALASFLAVASTAPAQTRWPVSNASEFAQALAAAAPGDRIVLTASFGMPSAATVSTSVTITSAPGTRQSLGFAGGSIAFMVRGLDPAIPLIFDDLDISVFEMAAGIRAVATLQPITGRIWFRNTRIEYGPSNGYQYGGVAMVDVDVDELRVDGCRFEASSFLPNFACIDLNGIQGVSCVDFMGQRLSIQDSDLIAGDAIFLNMHPTGCFGGSGIQWFGGTGGTALRANAPLSVLTSSTFTDGSGTSYANANWAQWGNTPTPGQPGSSQFVGAGGVLIAHGVIQTPGSAGVIGPPPAPQSGVVVGNPNADFTITGSPTLGSSVTTSIPTLGRGNAVLVIGVHWGPTPAVGSFLAPELATSQSVLITQASSQQWPIPNDPILRGLTIIAQVGYQDVSGTWGLTNPRTFWIR